MEKELGLHHLHKRLVYSLKVKRVRGGFSFHGVTAPRGLQTFHGVTAPRGLQPFHYQALESHSAGLLWTQRPLPVSTAHSQDTDIHDPGGIRTHNLSKGAAADRRLTPRVYSVRQVEVQLHSFFSTLLRGE
jgi:hypothetical protein